MDAPLIDGKIKLLFSEELLAKFIEVTSRPKLKKYFHPGEVSALLNVFDTYGEFVDVTRELKICRDPKDDFLLSLAADGRADFLVTGDKDLLVLERVEKTQIITFSSFVALIK